MATSEPVQGGPPPVHPSSTSSTQSQPLNDSSNDESQDTTASHDTDRVFTPPASDSGSSIAAGNGNTSSQESQLLQLSQLAAAQEKMVETSISKKRTADGAVKHTRNGSLTSPVRMPGHSRNTSTVSVGSTASRMSEVKTPNPCRGALGIHRITDHQISLQLSAELKTKLSYAMLKVNNGWQSHSIDEVESLASQAGSPTSSTSTLHGRHGASASPRVTLPSTRQGISSTGMSPISQVPPGRAYESFWRETNTRPRVSASPPKSQLPALAPPASIQPRQPGHLNPRRHSNAKYTPAFLSPTHHGSPHTPAQPSPLQSTPGTHISRTPNMDPIIFSPHQNVREQEALETLVFMSSPGNSANLKHAFPSSQQSRNGGANAHRTALPGSRLGPGADAHQMRKSLPTGRQGKRVGFEKSPSTVSDMDVDEAYGSPHIRGTPRRKTNGPKPSLSVPAGLSGPSRSRPALQDDDIERMLDRVAADDSSDSDGEIALPRSRRPGSAGVIGV